MRPQVLLSALNVIAAETMPTPRRQPYIVQGVVATGVRRGRRRIFLPPLRAHGKLLTYAAEEIDQAELDVAVRRGEFVRVATVPVPRDGGFAVVWRAGNGGPVVLSLRSAAAEFRSFHSEELRLGDEALDAGDRERALSHYEVAAAACQTPEAYARMLIAGLAPVRRSRILAALAEVSS